MTEQQVISVPTADPGQQTTEQATAIDPWQLANSIERLIVQAVNDANNADEVVIDEAAEPVKRQAALDDQNIYKGMALGLAILADSCQLPVPQGAESWRDLATR